MVDSILVSLTPHSGEHCDVQMMMMMMMMMMVIGVDAVRPVRMVTRSKSYQLKAGANVTLECQIYADSFDLFNYPVVWLKRQHHWPNEPQHLIRQRHGEQQQQQPWSSGVDVDDDLVEDCQVNMMGNLLEPFASFDRYHSTFYDYSPKYTFLLSLTGDVAFHIAVRVSHGSN